MPSTKTLYSRIKHIIFKPCKFINRSFNYSGYIEIDEKFVMLMQIEEGDTKGGIIIPKDRFKEFVEFKEKWVKEKK